MAKILFVYPNKEGYPIIPLGISVLSGILKNTGHNVELFDITFMIPERLDHKAREKTGVVKKVNVEKYWGTGDNLDIDEEFRKKIISSKPDLIAFSIVENNYGFAKKLFKIAKEITNTSIIVGGIFPTVAPEFFLNDENVDIICIGEGEHALLELADSLGHNNDISNISNLIIKSNGEVIKNSFATYYNWEPFIYQDWEEFDSRHLIEPFMGRMWRTGFFEASRGCLSNCSYCVNHTYQTIFKSLGKYHREKPIEYVIEEIAYMKKRYSLELIYFNDENFMMMHNDRFKEFCIKFRKRVNLPFFIQTRPETLIDEGKVKMLKDANCTTIGIGVESGNEKLRKEVLNKYVPDQIYWNAFDNCNKYNIRTTAYVMIGLPFETEEDILTTANFCKKLNTQSIAISIFAPYHGTKLYEVCVKNGFINNKYNEDISVNYSTVLKMHQLPKEKLEELYYKFNSLVYGDKEVVYNAH